MTACLTSSRVSRPPDLHHSDLSSPALTRSLSLAVPSWADSSGSRRSSSLLAVLSSRSLTQISNSPRHLLTCRLVLHLTISFRLLSVSSALLINFIKSTKSARRSSLVTTERRFLAASIISHLRPVFRGLRAKCEDCRTRSCPASSTSLTHSTSSSSWSGFSLAIIRPVLKNVSTAVSKALTTVLDLSDLCFCLTVLSGLRRSVTWITSGSREVWMEEVVMCMSEGSQENFISGLI